jgi:hypothetical protein
MLINAIEGVVQSGIIRLRDDVSLPENTKVYVIITEQNEGWSGRIHTPRLANPKQSGDFRKQIVEPPVDAKL